MAAKSHGSVNLVIVSATKTIKMHFTSRLSALSHPIDRELGPLEDRGGANKFETNPRLNMITNT